MVSYFKGRKSPGVFENRALINFHSCRRTKPKAGPNFIILVIGSSGITRVYEKYGASSMDGMSKTCMQNFGLKN